MLRVALVCSLAILLIPPVAVARKKPVAMRFTATAFSVSGTTAKGNSTKAGTAAADPSVIPLGSKVRVTGAGLYSGVYVVTDTGPKVAGRVIDLFIPSAAEAKAFGRKKVRVEILTAGDNVKNLPETTPNVPEHQLAPAIKP
jgi:3D (Asp-Asp-Asp) domain-containing protein